jgi:hypothetical protein
LRAALPSRFTAGILAGLVILVVAPAFCGAVALAHGPATDSVVPTHRAVVATHRARPRATRDIANAASAAPPVVVLLSTSELSPGPAQARGPVSLPMSFGQPVAPEDELATTPVPRPAPTRHPGASPVSRRSTHLAKLTAEDGVEVPDLSEFVAPAT